ncbi:hypothetical protein RHSIM_Rhsim11G0078000 [Rhododendron simsii]|uniref:Uncharacterized protein n=1 Tax=Rhododendron simsii TaxID=118357 RepID=A0A834G5Q3_RHOSS|nr:hypothetical protein RHSIM_Rhsim11G0078000 [Rhododendron simsii]
MPRGKCSLLFLIGSVSNCLCGPSAWLYEQVSENPSGQSPGPSVWRSPSNERVLENASGPIRGASVEMPTGIGAADDSLTYLLEYTTGLGPLAPRLGPLAPRLCPLAFSKTRSYDGDLHILAPRLCPLGLTEKLVKKEKLVPENELGKEKEDWVLQGTYFRNFDKHYNEPSENKALSWSGLVSLGSGKLAAIWEAEGDVPRHMRVYCSVIEVSAFAAYPLSCSSYCLRGSMIHNCLAVFPTETRQRTLENVCKDSTAVASSNIDRQASSRKNITEQKIKYMKNLLRN